MRSKLLKLASIGLLLFLGFIITSCSLLDSMFSENKSDDKSSSISISLTNNVFRTLVPELSMEPSSYVIEGSGPNGASFSQTATGSTLTVDSLVLGLWNVSVTALNVDETVVGSGSGDVTISSNETSQLTITIIPLVGNGSLDLTLSWPEEVINTPEVTAKLLVPDGDPIILNSTINGVTATLSATDIPSGYHTLSLELLDNSNSIIGSMEIVRIVTNQSTSGAFIYDVENESLGLILVNIIEEMADPLEITVIGASDTKAENTEMLLTASVTNYNNNVTYIWYVNGDNPLGTGNTFNLDDTYEQGYYNISVTAYSADGTRAGNETVSIQVVEPIDYSESALGMNLGGVKYYSSAWTFVDRMKNAEDWISYDAEGGGAWDSNIEVPVGPNGYPLQIPFGDTPQAVRAHVFKSFDDYPAGTYTLIFEGYGEISLSFAATGTFTEANTPHSFEIATPTAGGLLLSITRSDVNNPIRNIRIIMPGFEDNYEEQIFHPTFLERLEDFEVLRFMDWGRTNNSMVTEWAERGKLDYYTQATRGVAPEYMIELSNRLSIDPWICIPHMADDNYVRELAKLLAQELDPSLKIHIEYSNELWNNQFQQTHAIREYGMALGLHTDSTYAGLYYQARRSGEIFKIFGEELSSDRFVKVVGSQAANSWLAGKILEGLDDITINPTGIKADNLAIAPYFGGSIANDIIEAGEEDSITVDGILDLCEASIDSKTGVWTANNKVVADEHNVGLIAYEGGQHLVGTAGNENNDVMTLKLIAANRHPRMKDVYLKMLDAWTLNGGSLMTLFSNVGIYTKWGSWAMLEYQDQPIEDAPKYAAVQEYLDRH